MSDTPEITDEWAVVDKWWKDESEWERRVYVIVSVEGEQACLVYDRNAKTFSLRESALSADTEQEKEQQLEQNADK